MTELRRTVGVPVQELELQEQVIAAARQLVAPGRGYRLYAVAEVEARYGRADVIIVAASPNALRWYVEHGPRVGTESQARYAAEGLGGARQPHRAGALVGSSRERQLALLNAGVSPVDVRRACAVVPFAFLVEVKIHDWRSAVAQTRRYEGLVDWAAVAMPPPGIAKIQRSFVQRFGLGLIEVHPDWVEWRRLPKPRGRARPSLSGRYWMAELIARAYESGRLLAPERVDRRAV